MNLCLRDRVRHTLMFWQGAGEGRQVVASFKKRIIFAFCLSLLLIGCVMTSRLMKAPSISDSIPVRQGTATAVVLYCAESAVQTMAQNDDRWDARITRKDMDAGILETGNFEEENESGFRIKMDYDPRAGRIDIVLKGAGAYFVDLGVEAAIVEFNDAMRECLMKPSGP